MLKHKTVTRKMLEVFGIVAATLANVTPAANAVSPPDFTWVRRAGGSVSPTATAVDAFGNMFIAGTFHGPSAFGSTVLDSAQGSTDGFVSKLDPSGAWQWTRQMVASNTSLPHIRPSAIAIDPQGNVIVTGEAPSTTASLATFGTNQISLASCEVFVAKYSTEGECLWARGTGGADETYDHGVSVDAAGNIYVSGEMYQPTNFLVV